MLNQHPITPPPELVEQWLNSEEGQMYEDWVAIEAARWGADQELEAMLAELKALHLPDGYAARLRTARRPQPQSLKQQALAALEVIPKLVGFESEREAIRRALEALDD